MERTAHGSLISLTNSGSELRESAVHAIATELKVDYLVKTDIYINILDDYGVDQDQEIDCISIIKHNLKASRELEEINDIFQEIVTVAPELG